jgi:hypothetical protein
LARLIHHHLQANSRLLRLNKKSIAYEFVGITPELPVEINISLYMPIASKIMLLVKKKKQIVFAPLLDVCVFVLSKCISGPESAKADVRGVDYAGSATCKNGHQAI